MFPDLNIWFGIPKDGSTVMSHGFLKIYTCSPRGVDFCPLSLKVVWGTSFFFLFLEFIYIELQVYNFLQKSECRFYLGGMTLIVVEETI